MKKRIRHQQQLLKKRITKIKNKIRYVSIYFFLSMFTAYVVIGKSKREKHFYTYE